MKDEIKEILDEMKQICDVWVIMEGGVKTYNQDQIHCIYDYITNLEQENSEQLDENLKLSKWLVKKQKRIEKARDKIQYIIDYGFDYDGFNTVESLKGLIDMLVDYAKQSKDILNGGDE